jgi:hypothetical protein
MSRLLIITTAVLLVGVVIGITPRSANAAQFLASPVPPPKTFQVTSWFDHHTPGQTGSSYLPFRRYDGYQDSSTNSLCTGQFTCYCTAGINCYNGHSGVDLSTNYGGNGGAGYPIVAAAHGCVQEVDFSNAHGNYVRMWHPAFGLSTFYAHMQDNSTPVSEGQCVLRGDVVGYSGCTGICFGAHLHFGVYNAQTGGNPIDPYGWTGGGTDPWPYNQGYLWTSNPPSMYAPQRVHPNGTLIQAPNSQVFVRHANYRRYVQHQNVLDSWYLPDNSEIVPVTQQEANLYADCCITGYRPGKLVWHPLEQILYFITNDHPDPSFPNTPEYMLGRKIRILNPTVQTSCFGNLPYIVDPNGATLNLHGTGPILSTPCPTNGPRPNGTIVQNQSDFKVYILEEGTLVQKNTSPYEVYFITNEGDFLRGTKRHVANPTTLYCLFPSESIGQARVTELNNHPIGTPIQVSVC